MENEPSGFILINKPVGPTSHTIVNRMRKVTGIKKIGHAGTLDPFASGLLILGIGRPATRNIDKFIKLDKEYQATMKLGQETDTYDRTGRTIYTADANSPFPDENRIQRVLEAFTGKQEQTPPMFSAKKIGGKKLYELARKGIEIERKAVEITIFKIQLIEYSYPWLKISVRCSSGTYIRSLAFDIGRCLGNGAYLEELERIKIGAYDIAHASAWEDINQNNWESLLIGPSDQII